MADPEIRTAMQPPTVEAKAIEHKPVEPTPPVPTAFAAPTSRPEPAPAQRELVSMQNGPARRTPPQSEMIDADFDGPQSVSTDFNRTIRYK